MGNLPSAFKLSVTVFITIFSSIVAAETMYTVNMENLSGETILEQKNSGPLVVMVKPKVSMDATGDTTILDQCLWSVIATPENGSISYQPGKMICVGPKGEVLESIPNGNIVDFVQCADKECTELAVKSAVEATMTLSSPLEFSLQPRNERQ